MGWWWQTEDVIQGDLGMCSLTANILVLLLQTPLGVVDVLVSESDLNLSECHL